MFLFVCFETVHAVKEMRMKNAFPVYNVHSFRNLKIRSVSLRRSTPSGMLLLLKLNKDPKWHHFHSYYCSEDKGSK